MTEVRDSCAVALSVSVLTVHYSLYLGSMHLILANLLANCLCSLLKVITFKGGFHDIGC